MRRACLLISTFLLAAWPLASSWAAAPPPASSPSPAGAPAAPLPPELVTLLQKMQGLQVRSRKIAFALLINPSAGNNGGAFLSAALRHPPKSAPTRFPLLAGAGEETLSPAMGRFTLYGPFPPKGRASALLVKGHFYLKMPALARFDGGRPWLRTNVKNSSQALGVNPTEPAGVHPAGTATGPFASTIDTIDAAESVREVGPASVDHQAVTEFDAALSLPKLGKFSAKQLQALAKAGLETATMRLYVAPSGVPVRTTIGFGAHEELAVRADVLAINVPVAPVHAPPARRTISEARLLQLERKQLKGRKGHGEKREFKGHFEGALQPRGRR